MFRKLNDILNSTS